MGDEELNCKGGQTQSEMDTEFEISTAQMGKGGGARDRKGLERTTPGPIWDGQAKAKDRERFTGFLEE